MMRKYLALMMMVVMFSGCGVEDTKQNAEKYARTHLRTMKGWNNPVVQCFGVDTDRNGYVTCTVAERVGAPTERLECVANWVFEYNTGCRELQRTLNIVNQ